MKTNFLMLLLLLCGAGVTAQNPYIAPLGATEQNGGIVVTLPRTTLAVDVTVERDLTIAGPYARYAQKYLGVRSPLSDKTTYAVTDASVALLDGGSLSAAAPTSAVRSNLSHSDAVEEFARLQPDKTDMIVRSAEDAAREAANTIFSLRRHRLELITGEAGENVFGEGLKAALAEIERLEQSYLELFLGKRVVTSQSKRYMVYPQSNKKQYIVCRFSPSAGLLPDSDLSGDIVLLQIEPSGEMAEVLGQASAKESSFVTCRVAALSVCTVICGGREYARAVLPVFEFGKSVNMTLPRRK